MTRKDYVLIAKVINGAVNYEKDFNNNTERAEALTLMAHTFSSVLASENPRFDRERFLKACGV